MSGLILKLRAHEQILVNGVIMQNGDRSARLIVKTADAHILRLRDAIHPDEVDNPVKRVCYIAQLAVAGEVEPEQAAAQLGSGVAQLQDALSGFEGSEHLEMAIDQLRRRTSLRLALPWRRLARRGPTDGLRAGYPVRRSAWISLRRANFRCAVRDLRQKPGYPARHRLLP
jgi:flagellar protein FlbT